METRLHCFARLYFFCGSHVLFTEPASTKFNKYNFKTGSQALFTYFKFILLQYF